jgi:hypothetical protein
VLVAAPDGATTDRQGSCKQLGAAVVVHVAGSSEQELEEHHGVIVELNRA